MHLERALKDVEAAIAAANPKKSGVTKAQKQFAKIILVRHPGICSTIQSPESFWISVTDYKR